MPSNVPPGLKPKFERCLTDVVKSGKPKSAAFAICYNSVVKGKEINYRKLEIATDKAITDAGGLREDDARNCWNCQHFTKLPETHLTEEVADVAEQISAPSDFVEPSSGRGICAQYEFETDIEWVCDGWAQLEPPTMLETFKQADGRMRWVLFSSSSYQDRDGEIVSQKALTDDTDRMNASGDFGTLDWWHTPVILGDCDFSAMHGRISVESGTFRDEHIAGAIATAKGLGASRTFYNPATEPDANGVYHNIRTVSRAILPAERASNVLTRVYVAHDKETDTMFDEKIKKLKELLGGTPEAAATVDTLLSTAERTDKAAEAAGLTAKETDVAPTDDGKKAWFLADMTPEEFDDRLGDTVAAQMKTLTADIRAAVSLGAETQNATLKETNTALMAQLAETQKAQTELAARLAALEGITPRAYRASRDEATVIDAKTKKELALPSDDEMAKKSLANWLTTSGD